MLSSVYLFSLLSQATIAGEKEEFDQYSGIDKMGGATVFPLTSRFYQERMQQSKHQGERQTITDVQTESFKKRGTGPRSGVRSDGLQGIRSRIRSGSRSGSLVEGNFPQAHTPTLAPPAPGPVRRALQPAVSTHPLQPRHVLSFSKVTSALWNTDRGCRMRTDQSSGSVQR